MACRVAPVPTALGVEHSIISTPPLGAYPLLGQPHHVPAWDLALAFIDLDPIGATGCGLASGHGLEAC